LSEVLAGGTEVAAGQQNGGKEPSKASKGKQEKKNKSTKKIEKEEPVIRESHPPAKVAPDERS